MDESKVINFNFAKSDNNSYLIIENNDCVIIDPSFNVPEIEKYIVDHNLNLLAIVATHGHYDHVGKIDELLAKYKVQLYLYEKDREVLYKYHMGEYFENKEFIPPKEINFYTQLNLRFKSISLDIIPTPGHTIGGVTIIYKNYMFTGDVLFYGSVGNMDLPTGNPRELLMSLRKLKEIGKDLIVCPGHGKTKFSLDNPYFKRIVG